MPSPGVHLCRTMHWAIEEGMPAEDAQVVAFADAEVDLLWPGRTHWGRHFNPMARRVFARREAANGRRLIAAQEHREALVALGRQLHSLQDSVGHGRLGLQHLKYRAHLLRRHPDDWDSMPASTRERIERLTRQTIREFMRARDSRAAGSPGV